MIRRSPRHLVSALLLLACVALAGCALDPVVLTANNLQVSGGSTELIAGYHERPGGILSPGGRYLLLGRWAGDHDERFIWDLMTDQRFPFDPRAGSVCWLNDDTIIGLGDVRDYYLIHAEGARFVPAQLIVPYKTYPPAERITRLRERWAAASERYLVRNLLYSGTIAVTVEGGDPFVYVNADAVGEDDIDMRAAMAGLPAIELPESCTSVGSRLPLFSPDGRYYADYTQSASSEVQIFTREGELVAQAGKPGWSSRMLGWKYDSSGVYFQSVISGSLSKMVYQGSPLFKLSPHPSSPSFHWEVAALAALLLIGLAGLGYIIRRQRT